MSTSFSITLKGVNANDKVVSKSFSDISTDTTIAFGSQFATAYFDLTTLTPQSVTVSKSETVQLV